MSARLRDVEDMLTQLYATKGGEREAHTALVEALPPPGAPRITLLATTRAGQFFVGKDPISIARLPFTVGREPNEDEMPAAVLPTSRFPSRDRIGSRAPTSA